MTYRPNPDDHGWVTFRDRLLDCIAKWQKKHQPVGVSIDCAAAPRYGNRFSTPADRAVSVTFSAGQHVDRTVTVDRFERPVDNLWALAVGLDAIRLNELRGIRKIAVEMPCAAHVNEVTEQHYQFCSSLRQRDATFTLTMPLPNVWLGTSVENQHWADVRIPELLATPAAVRFLSCEPLLGPLSLTNLECFRDHFEGEGWDLKPVRPGHMAGLDWVIVGGESGLKARPFDLAWARSIVSQCRAAGVPVFVKQLGAKPFDQMANYNEKWRTTFPSGADGRYEANPLRFEARLKSRKGVLMAEWPEDLRVREWPRGGM